MKSLFKLAAAATLSALVLAACSSDDSPAVYYIPTGGSNPTVSVYSPSGSHSVFVSQTLKNLNVQSSDGSGVPDVFIVKVKDVQSYTNAQLILAVQTLLEGKTLILDAPTALDVVAFGTQLDYALGLEENAELKVGAKICGSAPWSRIHQLISALEDDDTQNSSFDGEGEWRNDWDAIGLKGADIYYVHSIPAQDQDLLASSAQDFARWAAKTAEEISASKRIDAKGMELLISKSKADTSGSLSNLMTAQTFNHTDFFYNGESNITVNTEINVWAACKIADPNDASKNKDYYLVRTSVTCHNEPSANSKNVCFYGCIICPNIDRNGQKTYSDSSCSPQTTQGSTSFTTSSGFSNTETWGETWGANFTFGVTSIFGGGGNFGGTHTEGTSETFSASSTTNIPDISVKLGSWNNYPRWDFDPPNPDRDFSNIRPIQKTAATFDTYAVYVLPSNFEQTKGDGKVELKTWINPSFLKRSDWKLQQSGLWYDDHVVKPNNACREYIMSFDQPEGSNLSIQDLQTLHAIAKQYVSYWNENVKIYAIGSDRLDETATSYFWDAMRKLFNNRDVLKGQGFSGKYTFYIKNSDAPAGTRVKTFPITF